MRRAACVRAPCVAPPLTRAGCRYEDLSEIGGTAGGGDSPDKTTHSLHDVMEGANSDVKIGVLQAGVIFFKSCFGVGVLGMPYAFRNSGVTAGVLSCIVIALATNLATNHYWIRG